MLRKVKLSLVESVHVWEAEKVLKARSNRRVFKKHPCSKTSVGTWWNSEFCCSTLRESSWSVRGSLSWKPWNRNKKSSRQHESLWLCRTSDLRRGVLRNGDIAGNGLSFWLSCCWPSLFVAFRDLGSADSVDRTDRRWKGGSRSQSVSCDMTCVS